MRRHLALVMVALAGVGLAGCTDAGTAAWMKEQGWAVEDWSEVRALPRPGATPTTYDHTVRFEPAGTGLGPDQARTLEAFLNRHKVGYGDRVALVAASDAAAVDEGRVAALGAALRSRHVPLGRLTGEAADQVDGGRPGDGAVRVIVYRRIAVLPACPDWTDRPGNSFSNLPHGNLGCASATNLGLMVADPGDLETGRTLAPADGHTQAEAVGRFRRGETKPLSVIDTGTTYTTE